MSELRDTLIGVLKEHGLERREEPFRLSSGELSRDYLDGKRALSRGAYLRLACEAILERATEAAAEFDAVGGLTLGADAYATGVAVLADKRWFVVRKKVKEHGKGKRVEGAELGPGVRVLLVDDVVTTGGAILEAFEVVRDAGATVVLAVAVVDRGDMASQRFAAVGVDYRPLITYRELGIDPVGAASTAPAR